MNVVLLIDNLGLFETRLLTYGKKKKDKEVKGSNGVVRRMVKKKSPVQAGSGKKRQGKQRWGRKDKENLTVINLSVDFAPKNVCFFSSAQASPPPDKQITRHNPNSNLPGRRAIKEEPLGRDEAGERPELTLRLMENWRWHEETDREEKWRRGSVKNGTTTV